MPEVTTPSAFSEEVHVSGDRCFDQPVVFECSDGLLRQILQPAAGGIGLLDLEGSVLLQPLSVGSFIGSLVLFGLSPQSLDGRVNTAHI